MAAKHSEMAFGTLAADGIKGILNKYIFWFLYHYSLILKCPNNFAVIALHFLNKETSSVSGFICSSADFYGFGASPKDSFSDEHLAPLSFSINIAPPSPPLFLLYVAVGKLDFSLIPSEFVASW